ncbi:MAG: hypothetical protein R3D67_06145 [Hyphomicrobiaceae bacterium]
MSDTRPDPDKRRRRVLLQLRLGRPRPVALAAAILVARAFRSELESLIVEDPTLLDIAGLPFAQEISFTGRRSRLLPPEAIERQMRSAAAEMMRQVEMLAREAEVPVRRTVIRSEPMAALASICHAEDCQAQIIAFTEPLSSADAPLLHRLFASLPGGTGLLAVGPTAHRSTGPIVGVVDDIDHFDAVLRATRHIFEATEESRFALLMAAESDAEAEVMEQQARLALGSDDAIDIVHARVLPNAPAMVAELLRRLNAGFIVSHFGGIIVPPDGDLRELTAVLQSPLLLIR